MTGGLGLPPLSMLPAIEQHVEACGEGCGLLALRNLMRDMVKTRAEIAAIPLARIASVAELLRDHVTDKAAWDLAAEVLRGPVAELVEEIRKEERRRIAAEIGAATPSTLLNSDRYEGATIGLEQARIIAEGDAA